MAHLVGMPNIVFGALSITEPLQTPLHPRRWQRAQRDASIISCCDVLSPTTGNMDVVGVSGPPSIFRTATPPFQSSRWCEAREHQSGRTPPVSSVGSEYLGLRR